MNFIIYNFLKILFYFSKNKEEYINNFFRYKGIKIGQNCKIYSNIVTGESFLITIKNNVTISNDVQLITHDNSIIKVSNKKYTDTVGEIIIEENVFIGAKSIILPGVQIAKNIVVGSGSVVTKSFREEGIIIAGNPARKIRKIDDDYKKNIYQFGINLENQTESGKKEIIMSSKKIRR